MELWTPELNAALTNAYNGTWWLGCYFITVFMLYLRHIRGKSLASYNCNEDPELIASIKETMRYQLGISLVSFGTGTIRLWWLIGKSAAPDGANFASWAPGFSGALFPFVLMIAVGYAYHQEAFMKELLGRAWWVPFFVICSLGAFAGLVLGHTIG